MDVRLDWVNIIAFLLGFLFVGILNYRKKQKKIDAPIVLKSILIGMGIALGGELVEQFLRLVVSTNSYLLGVVALLAIPFVLILSKLRSK